MFHQDTAFTFTDEYWPENALWNQYLDVSIDTVIWGSASTGCGQTSVLWEILHPANYYMPLEYVGQNCFCFWEFEFSAIDKMSDMTGLDLFLSCLFFSDNSD